MAEDGKPLAEEISVEKLGGIVVISPDETIIKFENCRFMNVRGRVMCRRGECPTTERSDSSSTAG